MNKPIGQIVGDMAAMLYIKGVLSLDEFKNVIGEDNFNKLIKEVENNDSKQSSAQSSREIR
jgi:hypothetical protein